MICLLLPDRFWYITKSQAPHSVFSRFLENFVKNCPLAIDKIMAATAVRTKSRFIYWTMFPFFF